MADNLPERLYALCAAKLGYRAFVTVQQSPFRLLARPPPSNTAPYHKAHSAKLSRHVSLCAALPLLFLRPLPAQKSPRYAFQERGHWGGSMIDGRPILILIPSSFIVDPPPLCRHLPDLYTVPSQVIAPSPRRITIGAGKWQDIGHSCATDYGVGVPKPEQQTLSWGTHFPPSERILPT